MGIREEQWMQKYDLLKEYYKEHGDSDVPSHSKDYPQLGRWVSKLRMNEHKLSAKQISLLNKLDFSWSKDVQEKKHARFMERYRELLAYKRKYGTANVPSKVKEEKYRQLGRWLEVLRVSERQEKLEPWKKEMLTKAGVLWSSQMKDQESERWTDMYKRLVNFVAKYGHANVPENWENDIELAKWVVAQRRRKRPLDAMRKKLLEDLNFRWNNEPLERSRDSKGRYRAISDD